MRLPWDRFKLYDLYFDRTSLLAAVLERREAIRNHRDQRGHDRCFLDDWLVWMMLDDTPEISRPTLCEGMEQCRIFSRYRRTDVVEPLAAGGPTERQHWDDDLTMLGYIGLMDELVRLQWYIRCHRDITDRPRIIDDDRFLYVVLPECVAPDLRLPPEPEFLGEGGIVLGHRQGCEPFWRSHEHCDPAVCDLHDWGPCPRGR